jgi:hypothetical protein
MNKLLEPALNAGLRLNLTKSNLRSGRNAPMLAVVLLLICILIWAARQVTYERLYTSGSDFGYFLGLAGGSMMLALLLYPLRKHVRFMRNWAPLKYWFRMHMVCGIGGPLFILFHSTFHVGSLNATVAVSCMLLVAASGIAGRFIYRKIHHGLYGSRATLADLQKSLADEQTRIQPLLSPMPAVRQEVDGFAALAAQHPAGPWRRTAHFVLLGWDRLLVRRRIHRTLARFATSGDGKAALSAREFARIMRTVDATLQGIQRTAQFSAYERLFSLWHILHVPFVYMFVISAIVHVVAVHTY